MRESTVGYSCKALVGTLIAFLCATVWAEGPNGRTEATDQVWQAQTPTSHAAVFAGGCFWGVEAVFEHVNGVVSVTSGYAGGSAESANYDQVSDGTTGHAEAVKITYDPSRISYGQLLKIFFTVAHDPTQMNRQGPDAGPQYRSEIFTLNDEQTRMAEAFIRQLTQASLFTDPIVTRVSRLPAFYEAEAYHQDFAVRHPNHRYIVIHDKPKVEQLKQRFPELFRER